ncbi:MAG: hypothetical protein C0464_02585 [Cyanobacteria bacterium DS2.008]|nr:hypothetical protein [Cyanobacteria bacterium DS2.008]
MSRFRHWFGIVINLGRRELCGTLLDGRAIRIGQLRPEQIVCWLTAGGILLRLMLYFANRPFWTDEAQLALNLINHSVVQLLGPLEYCQAAPVGFLLVEKTLLATLGDSEFVLRLFPLLAGIASLLLFAKVAKGILSIKSVPLAVGLFAFSEPLIQYSSELKQYSLDVLCSLLILYATILVLNIVRATRGLVVLAIVGIASPWFSYSSSMVMSASLLAVIAFYVKKKQLKQLWVALVIVSVWFISLAAVYRLSLQHLVNSSAKDALLDFRAVIPHDILAPWWLLQKLFEVLQYPGGFCLLGSGVSFICLFIGLTTLFKKDTRLVSVMVLPFVFAIAGSWFAIYPLFGRFLLFLVPLFLLAVAEGATRLFNSIACHSKAAAALAISLLFIPPCNLLKVSDYKVTLRRTEIRDVLQYVASQRLPKDKIYVYYGAYFPVLYYCKKFALREENFIIGVPGYWWNTEQREVLTCAWQKSHPGSEAPSADTFVSYNNNDYSKQWFYFERDIDLLKEPPRVWFIFSHTVWLGTDEEPVFLYFLDRRGQRLDHFQRQKASAYLYDLTKAKRPNAGGPWH